MAIRSKGKYIRDSSASAASRTSSKGWQSSSRSPSGGVEPVQVAGRRIAVGHRSVLRLREAVAVVDDAVLIVVDQVLAQVERHRRRGVDHQHDIDRSRLGDGGGVNRERVDADDRQEGEIDEDLGLDPNELAVRIAGAEGRAQCWIVRRRVGSRAEGFFADEDFRRPGVDAVEVDELGGGGRQLANRAALAELVGGRQGGRVDCPAQMADLGEEDARIDRQADERRQADEGQGDQDQGLTALSRAAHPGEGAR
jgi:hypothetical protein